MMISLVSCCYPPATPLLHRCYTALDSEESSVMNSTSVESGRNICCNQMLMRFADNLKLTSKSSKYHDNKCSDTDPLIAANTISWQNERKRKTSGHGPFRQKLAKPVPRKESPGSQYGRKHIQNWLEQCSTSGSNENDTAVLVPPPTTKEVKCSAQKFVMIQVFRRDTLMKSDLLPLSGDDNTEIHVAYNRDTARHQDTTDYRSFQISRTDPFNSEDFKRQFGGGIRLYCRQGKDISILKSTEMPAFCGTQKTPTWSSLTDTWQHVYNFSQLEKDTLAKASKPGKDVSDSDDYNRTTACLGNVVRVTVGCVPNCERIYDTDFHVKLSFVMH